MYSRSSYCIFAIFCSPWLVDGNGAGNTVLEADTVKENPQNKTGVWGKLKVEIEHTTNSTKHIERAGAVSVRLPVSVRSSKSTGPRVQLRPLEELQKHRQTLKHKVLLQTFNKGDADGDAGTVDDDADKPFGKLEPFGKAHGKLKPFGRAHGHLGHPHAHALAVDVDVDMPYGELEPFGRENTAQELTEASIHESDAMVDQMERAEVAEEKRAAFRALTRLRGAAITSYDGVARAQTSNIDEYSKVNKWRANHPMDHLAEQESDVAKWAFPSDADFL